MSKLPPLGSDPKFEGGGAAVEVAGKIEVVLLGVRVVPGRLAVGIGVRVVPGRLAVGIGVRVVLSRLAVGVSPGGVGRSLLASTRKVASVLMTSMTQRLQRSSTTAILYTQRMLTHIDLFTGLAGFTRTLTNVSKPVLYCEKDPLALTVLRNNIARGNLPCAQISEDITKLSKTPRCNIVTAGWPCTGHSPAGNHQGFKNKDSSLFRAVKRVVLDSRASILLLENVPAVMSPPEQHVIEKALTDLGFFCAWTLLPAYAIGLPHNRNRWFCVCYRAKKHLPPLLRLENNSVIRKQPTLTQASPLQGAEYSDYWKRWCLLGVSLVPQCAAAAVVHIVRTVQNSQSSSVWLCVPTLPRAKPDLGLKLTANGVTVAKPLWPSPRTNKYYAKNLSERTSLDLQNAVKFATGKGANIEWVEWLMGYPRSWTLLR